MMIILRGKYMTVARRWEKVYIQYGTKFHWRDFPGGAVVESLPANAGHTGSSPDLGRSHMPQSN